MRQVRWDQLVETRSTEGADKGKQIGMEWIVIGAAAIVTSILSAVAGLGGGVILLAVIAQFFVPVVAIPIHGGIQLVSNGSRAALLRGEINRSAVAWASLLLLPASIVGVAVATSIPTDATRLAMAAFVLVLAWRPSILRPSTGAGLSERDLVVVGGVSGFLNSTVGASGPVTSPFFRAVTAGHTAFVATAAAAQVVAHASKIVAFGLDGFAVTDHLGLMAVGAVGVMIGSWIGTRLLGTIDESHLGVLFKVVLTALAARMIAQALT